MTSTSDGCASSTAEDRLEAAGRRAAKVIEHLWKQDIIDPPIGSKHPLAKHSLDVINAIILRNGWTWLLPYKGNGPPQWCTMTDGYCWTEAGMDPSWLRDYWASTDRMLDWALYRRWNPEVNKSKPNPAPAAGTPRRLLVDLRKPLTIDPRAGDVVLVGTGKRHAGDHGTLLMGYADGEYDTISGNGGGVGPNGDPRDFRGGISRRNYKIGTGGYEPMWLIRPAPSDLP